MEATEPRDRGVLVVAVRHRDIHLTRGSGTERAGSKSDLINEEFTGVSAIVSANYDRVHPLSPLSPSRGSSEDPRRSLRRCWDPAGGYTSLQNRMRIFD